MNPQSFLRTVYLWLSIVSAVICLLIPVSLPARAALPKSYTGKNGRSNASFIAGILSNLSEPDLTHISTGVGGTFPLALLTREFDSAVNNSAIDHMQTLHIASLPLMVSTNSGGLSGKNPVSKIHCALLNRHCPGGQKL